MKSADLLQKLEAQLEQLAQAVAPHANSSAARARFDQQLFHCPTTRLGDYLQEVRQNMALLHQSVADNRADRVAWMAERVVLQMGALTRELATFTLRKAESAPQKPQENLYEKLAEHQEFERRLRAMIADREVLLANCATLTEQQQLQREVAALEGRLQRCRQAVRRIEYQIENRERLADRL